MVIDNKEGINKKISSFILVSCFIILLMSIVIADIGVTHDRLNIVTINAAGAAIGGYGLSINQTTSYIFNLSINYTYHGADATDAHNLTSLNVSLWNNFNYSVSAATPTRGSNGTGNLSGGNSAAFKNTTIDGITVLSWYNSTGGNLINSTGPLGGSQNGSFFWFNGSADVPGKYNISIRFYYNHSVFYNETNITIRVNDTRKPYNVNVTTNGKLNTAITHSNLSDLIFINVSAFDNGNLLGLGDDVTGVNITIFNYTEGINNSYMATKVAGTHEWDYNLDTTKFPDGPYNISIVVNDTDGNINRTTNISVNIDNTHPSGTYSCSPVTVNVGDIVTCTCTPSDTFSNINTTATGYDATPSTQNTGTHEISCSYQDLAGNTGIAYTTYYVEMSGGVPPSGTGPSGTTTPVTKTSSFAEITPETPVTMTNFAADSGVKEIQVEVSQTASNVKVTVSKYETTPSAVSTSKTGTYKYLKVDTQNLADKLSKATMTIQVEKTWVSGQGITKEDVALFKYDETSSQWNELTTTYASEDATYYYYTAEVNSFSYFAIASSKVTEEAPPAEEQPTGGMLGLPYWVWIIIGLVGLVIIIGGGAALRKKKK